MIVSIKATFECDRCGNQFRVTIDPAFTPDVRAFCPMDFAENALRNGYGHEDADGKLTDDVASMDRKKHHCQVCTRKLDERAMKRRKKA